MGEWVSGGVGGWGAGMEMLKVCGQEMNVFPSTKIKKNDYI